MPYDALLMFCEAQTITANANSTDTLDFGQPGINPRSPTGARFPAVHNGTDPALVIKVGQTFAGSTALTINLQGSDDGTTFVNIASITPPQASLVAGAEFGIAVARHKRHRFERLNFVVTGEGTAGQITAGYADGYQTAGTV